MLAGEDVLGGLVFDQTTVGLSTAILASTKCLFRAAMEALATMWSTCF